jgi:hypothetical protein
MKATDAARISFHRQFKRHVGTPPGRYALSA